MSVKFSDLVQIYRESEPINGSDKRSFGIKTKEQIIMLKQLISDEHYNDTALEVEGELKVGSIVTLTFGTLRPQFGRFFKKLDDLIKFDIVQLNNTSLSQSSFFITSDNIASFDDEAPVLKSYQVVMDFLRQLIIMDSYTDKVNKKLIFFSKKTFELSIDVTNKLSEFSQHIRELDDEQRKLVTDFQEWLNNEETSSHVDEKKSILAFVLSDSLPSDADFLDVIQHISHISEAVQAQYALYLENFSYEKFIKKLEENTEKFVVKINDTISKSLPQFLGLPFLTAIPTALKSGDNWLVYVALIIYCVMCFYGLTNQKLILDHIKQDVEQFENKGKIPEKLKPQWREDKDRIERLLRKQRHLYRVLLLSLVGCFCYGLLKLLFQTGVLKVYCG